jgi:uncharacterized protein DUF1236
MVRLRQLAFVAAAALVLGGTAAHSQAPGSPAPGSADMPTVNLTVEQRHVIKEIVKDLNVRSAPVGDMKIGAVVPEAVTLQQIPSDVAVKVPQIKSHVFFVKDGEIALVDPKDRKIVDVIE